MTPLPLAAGAATSATFTSVPRTGPQTCCGGGGGGSGCQARRQVDAAAAQGTRRGIGTTVSAPMRAPQLMWAWVALGLQ